MPYFRVPSEGEDARDPDTVAIEEAAAAAIYTCRSQFGMPRDALVFEAGKALGFKISTPTAKLLIESAIDMAEQQDELTVGPRMVK